MIFEQPKLGDKLEYYNGAGWLDIKQDDNYWDECGTVTFIEGNFCYFNDPSVDPESIRGYDKQYYETRGVGTNNCFIWHFHDTNNKLFRIKK